MKKEAWRQAWAGVEISFPAIMSKGNFCVLEASQGGLHEMVAEMQASLGLYSGKKIKIRNLTRCRKPERGPRGGQMLCIIHNGYRKLFL